MILSILIPAYNEEGVIESTICSLYSALSGAFIDHEILVVNDGSLDRTECCLIRLESKVPTLRYINNLGPHGYGYALRVGLDYYRGDAVVITMADGSDSPADVVAYFQQITEGYDCSFGSRFTRGAKVKGYPGLKRIVNRLGNRLVGLFLWSNYDDFTNGFKCYRRHVINSMQPLVSGQFNLTIEMSMKAVASGARYALIATDWRDRDEGVSNFKLSIQSSLYLLTLLYTLLVIHMIPAIAMPARSTVNNGARSASKNHSIYTVLRSWPLGRPFLFIAVGFIGLGVYMLALLALHHFLGITFLLSNLAAIVLAMVNNFALNNVLTYGDRRLSGTAFFVGLFSFAISCSAGALVNIFLADILYHRGFGWAVSGFLGSLVASIFNYVATSRVTWQAKSRGDVDREV